MLQPTMSLICKTLKESDCPISAKGLVAKAQIEPTSENIIKVRDELFDLVESNYATSFYCENGTPAWFFSWN